MKRVLELIISLIATAATYALMHVVLFMDLFKFQHKLPVYVPTVIAVIVGLIFYFLLATPLAGLLLKRLNQTEERLSKMNLKELSLSVIGCIVGLVLANLIGMAFNGFGALGTFIVVLLNILFGILGIRVARRKKDDVNVRTLKEVLMTTPPSTAEDTADRKFWIPVLSLTEEFWICCKQALSKGKSSSLILFWRSCAILRILRTA